MATGVLVSLAGSGEDGLVGKMEEVRDVLHHSGVAVQRNEAVRMVAPNTVEDPAGN